MNWSPLLTRLEAALGLLGASLFLVLFNVVGACLGASLNVALLTDTVMLAVVGLSLLIWRKVSP